MAHWQRTDNWLAGIAESDHPNHGISTSGDLTPAMVQAAFDAHLGKGEVSVRDHGTVITVFCYPAYARSRRERGDSEAEITDRLARLKEGD